MEVRKQTRSKFPRVCKGDCRNKLSPEAAVEAANRQEDPMVELKSFRNFSHHGLQLTIECSKADKLPLPIKQWLFYLTKNNMEALYSNSDWGWHDYTKRKELWDPKAWYLVCYSLPAKTPLAFVHFRFVIENKIEVLYCYELQLEKTVRRQGLGRHLMLILELMALKTNMKKVVLTVFKHNVAGREFFMKKMRYEVDDYSPTDPNVSYLILSKKIPGKKE